MAGLGGPYKPTGISTLAGLFGPAGVTTSGGLAEIAKRLAVWRKGHVIEGHDPAVFRKDDFGNWMKYSDYGNDRSGYGWEIDHIRPKAFGGSDDLNNLRPLYHGKNSSLGGSLSGFFK